MKHSAHFPLLLLLLLPVRIFAQEAQAPKTIPKAIRHLSSLATHTFDGGVDTAWVRHYASGAIRNEDAAGIVLDASGEYFYVTGSRRNTLSGMDFLTIKYDTSGVKIWAIAYNGEANADDYAAAIANDSLGNIYVTGKSKGNGSGYDFVTVKYSPNGERLWTSRYNAPANADDEPSGLTLDHEGNIYAAGISMGVGTWNDFLTISYTSEGVERWVARYNGPGNGEARVAGIAVDRNGGVYVAGATAEFNATMAFTTIKYDHLGIRQWVARDIDPARRNCFVNALALDNSGNVYVAGAMVNDVSFLDFATIKYNRNGVRQWVAYYNGPNNEYDQATAVAVDVGRGFVYVTGKAAGLDGRHNYATIQYTLEGEQRWVRLYDGFAAGEDIATVLALDDAGGIYVTGNSRLNTRLDFATIKYDHQGVRQWIARYSSNTFSEEEARALAVDKLRNVYVVGQSDKEVVAVKYDAIGEQKWAKDYDVQGVSSDFITSVAIDAASHDSDVYVSGIVGKVNGIIPEFATIKYNAQGESAWIHRVPGVSHHVDKIVSLLVDANLYLVGSGLSTSTNSYVNFFTGKLNLFGEQQWLIRDTSSVGNFDFAKAFVVDRFGSIYVTGSTYGGTGTRDNFMTIKYNAAGVEQWRALYNGPGSGYDAAEAIVADDSGNVYVSGWSYAVASRRDYATIKYDADGARLWLARYSGLKNGDDIVTAMALDDSGNVYVTGYSVGKGKPDQHDYATIKYNSAGKQLWAARYENPAGKEDQPVALATVPASQGGGVYVTGWSTSNDKGTDYVTIKYDAAGKAVWLNRFDGAGHDDKAVALAYDRTALGMNFYVTGWSLNEEGNKDIVTLKYGDSGEQQWLARYSISGVNNTPSAIAVDAGGNVFVAGSSSREQSSIYTTIKYVQKSSVSVKSPASGNPSFFLSQNYPNPFNPTTNIKYHLPFAAHVTLRIFDLTGREVTVLVKALQPAGGHSAQWQAGNVPSGVYFYRLESKSLSGTKMVAMKKLILLK